MHVIGSIFMIYPFFNYNLGRMEMTLLKRMRQDTKRRLIFEGNLSVCLVWVRSVFFLPDSVIGEKVDPHWDA